MKNLIGKKARGFKFEDGVHNGIAYSTKMEKYVGKIGLIDWDSSISVRVNFGDVVCYYPAELIEQHIVDEDTLTPQGKAIHLLDKFIQANGNSFFAKQCALMAIQFAEKIMTEYGRETNELQNMDRFFNELEQVKTEIEKL